MSPHAMIFMMHSAVKMIRKTYSTFSYTHKFLLTFQITKSGAGHQSNAYEIFAINISQHLFFLHLDNQQNYLVHTEHVFTRFHCLVLEVILDTHANNS